jgi:plastocyanin
MTMPSLKIAFVLGSLCGLALASAFAPQAEAQGAASVRISNFTFAPGSVTVKARQAVTFTNDDGSPHSVVVNGKPFKTPTLEKGKSAKLTIPEPGSYDYVCGLHPSMTGTIVVVK